MLVLAYEGIQLFVCSTSIEHCMATATTVQILKNKEFIMPGIIYLRCCTALGCKVKNLI